MNHFFAYLARMRYIKRWGLMRSAIPENDAEHTMQTAAIAHALALIRKEIYGKDCDPDHAAALALYHDASEVFTGDMPTPVKYFDDTLRDAYGKIETMARQELLETLPKELREAYRPYVVSLEEDALWPLAKAADTLSAYLKCVEEEAAGNGEFSDAAKTIETKLREKNMPEVNWFLDHFAGSFRLTLDEMKKGK